MMMNKHTSQPNLLLFFFLIVIFVTTIPSSLAWEPLWNVSHPYGVYTSASITRRPQDSLLKWKNYNSNQNSFLAYAIGATSLVDAPQDPDEAEVYALPGTGHPLLRDKGPNIKATSSRNGSMMATFAYDQQTKIGRIQKYVLSSTGEASLDWTLKLSNAMPGAQASIVLSDDGSTLSFAWYNFDKNVSTISSFRWNHPENPVGKPDIQSTYEEHSGIYLPLHLCISADGDVVAFHLGSQIRVVDTKTGDRRWGKELGYTDGVVDVSQDGTYLASGFESMTLWKWDRSIRAYRSVWNVSPPSGAAFAVYVALSKGDRTLVGIGWNDGHYHQNFVETYAVNSSKPLMHYKYEKQTSSLQDVISSIQFLDDPFFMVVGSWGTQTANNYQLRVLRTKETAGGEYLDVADIHTEGSVFASDIMLVEDKLVMVVAGTKKVHANTKGRGGNFFAVKIELVD
eukprot:gb/GECH01011797.1/.p1 GENE.gb/GECH01011797.1/~~gb/GECH01011797.1/.p1  ORF type:complete len:454 (+),score=104.72 gb/GECH01011797.1/:1-1362(+)